MISETYTPLTVLRRFDCPLALTPLKLETDRIPVMIKGQTT